MTPTTRTKHQQIVRMTCKGLIALPTDDKVFRVTYDQSKVPTGKVPYTAEEFFAQVIDSEDHAKVGAEATSGT